jgi:hypothetical protein
MTKKGRIWKTWAEGILLTKSAFRKYFRPKVTAKHIGLPIAFDLLDGQRPDLDAQGVDHEWVALVMPDGMPVPGRRRLCRMRLVYTHVADFMIVRIENRDLMRLLEHLHSKVSENERHALGPTLVARSRIGHAGLRYLAVLLHGFRRMALQDRIGVIADRLIGAAHAVPARPVSLGRGLMPAAPGPR